MFAVWIFLILPFNRVVHFHAIVIILEFQQQLHLNLKLRQKYDSLKFGRATSQRKHFIVSP